MARAKTETQRAPSPPADAEEGRDYVFAMAEAEHAARRGSEAHLSFAVDAAETGERLDRFLARRAAAQQGGLSRSRIKSLIESGAVAIGTSRITDASAKIRAGQTVQVEIPPPVDPVPRGEAMPLVICYEDEHLIVIDKPAGLVVHPAPGHGAGTLVNALIAHCGDQLSGIGGVKRPGIVHRLDKDTSGLIVVAKTDAAHQGLAALFADHGRNAPFIREYLAFAWGVPSLPSGTICAPLARHKTDREKMAVVPDGREAITHWEQMEVFLDREGEPVASLLRCALETGRTHQIRVHLAHSGHPLMSDPLYGRGFKTKASRLGPKAQTALAHLARQALHAASLGFQHPVTKESLEFESALPQDLRALHTALARGL